MIASIISGLLIGLGSIGLKMSMNSQNLCFMIISLLVGGSGVLIFQYALRRNRASIASSISIGVSTMISVMGGLVYLKEIIYTHQIVGILLIVVGILLIRI